MNESTRYLRRTLDALENIVIELERLRVLREHELCVRLEDSGHSPYVPKGQ
jgi:hypothetical protein